MAEGPRRYRRKPLAAFENGTRIYAASSGEDCYRVIAADANGNRLFHKYAREEDARAKARELEAYLASKTPLYGRKDGDRTVGALAGVYVDHLASKSVRYRERQSAHDLDGIAHACHRTPRKCAARGRRSAGASSTRPPRALPAGARLGA